MSGVAGAIPIGILRDDVEFIIYFNYSVFWVRRGRRMRRFKRICHNPELLLQSQSWCRNGKTRKVCLQVGVTVLTTGFKGEKFTRLPWVNRAVTRRSNLKGSFFFPAWRYESDGVSCCAFCLLRARRPLSLTRQTEACRPQSAAGHSESN